MDTGEGRMEMLNDFKAELLKKGNKHANLIFTVGEIVNIKDSRFRVTKITPKKLTLRILPWVKDGVG